MESFLRDIVSLTKQKEDEVTWSKIDTLLSKVSESLNDTEDVQKVYLPIKDLLLRSILSDRSKLSGTALALLNKTVEISKGEIPNVGDLLPVLFKICGRSNRIVSKRGQDGVVNLCRHIDLTSFVKTILEFVSSTNKNVRLSVFQGIEASFSTRDMPRSFQKILLKGKEDPFLDVRVIAKRILERAEGPREPLTMEPSKRQSVMIPLPSLEKTVPIITHSPLKKVFKTENKVDKINAIEEKVKTIINPKTNRTKVQKIIETYNTRDLLQAIPKKEKEVHDDLTPKKLDRFLSKYRNVYGDVLKEEVHKMEVHTEEEHKMEVHTEEEHKMEVHTEKEHKREVHTEEEHKREVHTEEEVHKMEVHTEEEHKMEVHTEKSGEEDKQGEGDQKNDMILEEEQKDEVIKEDQKDEVIREDKAYSNLDGLIESYQKDEAPPTQLHPGDPVILIESIEKDVYNLSIVEEDAPASSSPNFDFTIVNSEGSKLEIKEELKKCPPVVDISSNRFSPLLHADKDECVIYDINREDPKFKTPSNVPVKDKTFTSPLDIPVVKNSLSSSFLYSKEDDKSLSEDGDYTQIDSCIYVDKKAFSRSEKTN